MIVVLLLFYGGQVKSLKYFPINDKDNSIFCEKT